MDVVQDISDWVVVMAEGAIIAEGTPEDISANPQVIDAYLGSHQDTELFDEIEHDVADEEDAAAGASVEHHHIDEGEASS
jgi:branched-chain amino acid transport system ATP-binding protein